MNIINLVIILAVVFIFVIPLCQYFLWENEKVRLLLPILPALLTLLSINKPIVEIAMVACAMYGIFYFVGWSLNMGRRTEEDEILHKQ